LPKIKTFKPNKGLKPIRRIQKSPICPKSKPLNLTKVQKLKCRIQETRFAPQIENNAIIVKKGDLISFFLCQ
jgi:hypothetical protein